MSRYWKKKIWEEYGVIVKKIKHSYNPLTSWGFCTENYILYYFVGSSAGSLIANFDTIFHNPQDIIKFLEEQRKGNEVSDL